MALSSPMYQLSVDSQLEDAPFLSGLYPTPDQDYGVGLTPFQLKAVRLLYQVVLIYFYCKSKLN